jgi:hypothetical protein
MEKTHVELFLEKVRTDNALREKVLQFEEKARASAMSVQRDIEINTRANALSMVAIAKEAGYDIPIDFFRGTRARVSPTEQEIAGSRCTLTCCIAGTSCFHTCWLSIW